MNKLEKDDANRCLERIHSISGCSVEFECRALPTLSLVAVVVMEDSMHKTAAMASNRVTSFLNISLACAAILRNQIFIKENRKQRMTYPELGVSNFQARAQLS